MRKISAFICVCLVCLVLCFSIPTKSLAVANDNDNYQYSVLQFDYIEDAYCALPCPFNFSAPGTVRQPFEFFDYQMNGYVNLLSGSSVLEGYLNAIGGSYFKFYSSLQVVRVHELKKSYSYYVSPGIDSMYFAGADVSCYVLTLGNSAYNSDAVYFERNLVAGSIPVTANGSIDFGSGLYELLCDCGFADDSLVLISDLSFTVPFTTDTVNTPSIFVSANTNTLHTDQLLGQWITYNDIVIPDSSSDFNLGTWLADSVNGFLEAEIFPGFSIDKIFYIILVVGLLMWFFRLIS